MPDDRIGAAWGQLAPHLLTPQDPLLLRSVLEDLYDAAQDDLIAELRGVEAAAAAWEVSERRARAHIARLHEKHGIGWRLGGAWLLRQGDIDRYPPDRKYRVKEGNLKQFASTQNASGAAEIVIPCDEVEFNQFS